MCLLFLMDATCNKQCLFQILFDLVCSLVQFFHSFIYCPQQLTREFILSVITIFLAREENLVFSEFVRLASRNGAQCGWGRWLAPCCYHISVFGHSSHIKLSNDYKDLTGKYFGDSLLHLAAVQSAIQTLFEFFFFLAFISRPLGINGLVRSIIVASCPVLECCR